GRMSDGFFLTRERHAEFPDFCVRAWARWGAGSYSKIKVVRYHTMDLAYSSADWGIFSSRRSSRGRRVWYRGNHLVHLAEAGNFEAFERPLRPAKGRSTPANLMCEMSDVFQSKALEKSPLGGRPQAVKKRWYRGFRQCRPEGSQGICSPSRAHE